MSLISWLFVSVICVLIVIVGYAGVTGKSIFAYKHKNNHKRPHH